MKINWKDWTNWAGFGFAAVAILIVCNRVGAVLGMSKSDWAAWVQAIGSIGAIWGALYVAKRQHDRQFAIMQMGEIKRELNIIERAQKLAGDTQQHLTDLIETDVDEESEDEMTFEDLTARDIAEDMLKDVISDIQHIEPLAIGVGDVAVAMSQTKRIAKEVIVALSGFKEAGNSDENVEILRRKCRALLAAQTFYRETLDELHSGKFTHLKFWSEKTELDGHTVA